MTLATQTPMINRLVSIARHAVHPVATPTRSRYLQDLLDSPPELRDVFVGHLHSDVGAPAGAIEQITAVLDELFDACANRHIFQLDAGGWLEFIGDGPDAYERGLICQIVWRLHRLLGALPTERFPVAATVTSDRVPPGGAIRIGRGGHPTRAMTDLEVAMVRYTATPLPKLAATHRGELELLRRCHHTAAVAIGFIEAGLATSELTHIEQRLLADAGDRKLSHPDPADPTRPPIMLGAWASYHVHQLRQRDMTANTDSTGPWLYTGQHHPDHLIATNSMNNMVRTVLHNCGLDQAGVNSTSLRLWSANQAITNGTEPAQVATRLGLTRHNGQPDVARLNEILAR